MDRALGSTFYVKFTTRAFATGIPTTLLGSPVLSVLEQGNATPITSGVSISVDRASVTGLNEATIVATSGNGYEAGKSYGLYVSTGTVDSVSVVGEVVSEFSIDLESKDTAVKVWDEIITGVAHNTNNSAGKRLRQTSELGTYSGGQIFIDTNASNTNTTDFEDGTEVNPVSTIAAANTLAASLTISKFHIAPGSSITLGATQANQVFEGESWTLALGGRSIDGSTFIGATVSGIATNTSDHQFFKECIMGAVTLPSNTHVLFCGLDGTQTAGEAGDFYYDFCHSAVAGSGSIIFDFGSGLAASDLNIRHHSGGWTIANMGAGAGTYLATFEGHGQITWAASCSATSNASVRGHWRVTDLASGAVTVTKADMQANIDTILVDTADMQPKLGSPAVDLAADIAALNDVSTANILTQVNAALDTAIAELGVGAPTATPTVRTALMLQYMAIVNKRDTTSASDEIHKADGTVIMDAVVSDDTVIFSKAKYIAP